MVAVRRNKPLGRAPLRVRTCRMDIHHPDVFDMVKSGSLQGLIRVIGQNIAAVRKGDALESQTARQFMESGVIAGAYLLANGHGAIGERYLSDAVELLPRFVPDYLDSLDGLLDALDARELAVSDETAQRMMDAIESAIDAEAALYKSGSDKTSEPDNSEPTGWVDICIHVSGDTEKLLSGLQAIGFAPDALAEFKRDINDNSCVRIRDLSPARADRVIHISERLGLTGLRRNKTMLSTQCSESELDKADALMDSGDIAAALDILVKSIECDPLADDLWYTVGSCYVLANEFDGALGAYLEAIAINPNDADYYRQAGLCAWKTGDAALAIKHLAECLARIPDDSVARETLQIAGGAPVEAVPAGDSANTLAFGLSADDINAEIADAAASSESSVTAASAPSSGARTPTPASANVVSRSRRLKAALDSGAFDAPPPAAARAAYAAKLLDLGDPTGNPKARLALDETSRSAGLTNIQAARIEAQVSGRISAFDSAIKRYAELYALSLASMAAPDSVETAGMLEFLRLTATELGLRDRVVGELQTIIRSKSIDS